MLKTTSINLKNTKLTLALLINEKISISIYYKTTYLFYCVFDMQKQLFYGHSKNSLINLLIKRADRFIQPKIEAAIVMSDLKQNETYGKIINAIIKEI